MRAPTDMDTWHVDADVRGHHIYKTVWTPFVGEILLVQQEDHNTEDSFAEAILKSGKIVGHGPREISQIVWYFIEHDGTVSCEVTGPIIKFGMLLHILCKEKANFKAAEEIE